MSKAIEKTNSRQQTKSKFEVVTVSGVKLTIDLSEFHETESPWFNATDMAKPFNKVVYEWLRSVDTVEYINALEVAHPEFKVGNFPTLEHRGLIRIVKGKHGGTYLHKRLAIPFARWCCPSFAVALDDFIYFLIEDERKRKDAREEARTGFRPLTDAIKDSHESPKTYHYSNEINMIYVAVTGKQAKKLREELGLKDHQPPIDYLPKEQVKAIAMLQRMDETFILMGDEYDRRKEKLVSFFHSKLESGLSVKQIAKNIEA